MTEPETTKNFQYFQSRFLNLIHRYFPDCNTKKSANLKALLRLVIIAAVTFTVCKFFLMPCVISGGSMEPTYHEVGFNFCVITDYTRAPLRRGDVVIASYFEKSFLLKRVIALPGEVIAIVNGQVFINNRPLREDYVKFSGSWNLPPRLIKPGNVYLMGDNRSMPIEQHNFGQVPIAALKGHPLW